MLQVPEFRFRNLNTLCRTADPARLLPNDKFSIKPGILNHLVYKVNETGILRTKGSKMISRINPDEGGISNKVRKVNKVHYSISLRFLHR
jgi:hypothetical protein